MSTSALIKVEGVDYAELYKHWDGYPEATLEWLEHFNEDFTKNRGNDPEYKFAQLVRSSIREADYFNLDNNPYTGWGVVEPESWDCDFLYVLNKDGSVTIK